MSFASHLLCVGLAASSANASSSSAAVAATRVDFAREVRPVLVARCFACHGPDADARKAGLRLDTFEGATAKLKSGIRAIVPGDASASALLARVTHADSEERMPPDGREPVTPAEIASIARWIESGAEYTAPWAFSPMTQPTVPTVRGDAWCRSDIDRFVLATQEAVSITSTVAPPIDVDATSLMRRASFDLRGLPPSEAEIKAFAADPSDANFAAFVDRSLASEAFGERWGRHWLDLARYAETLAHEFDYDIPSAWRYREYVIDALNRDVPPARFVAEHLAGDLLEPRASMGLANAAPLATAWWFLGPATHAPVDVRQDEADRIAGAVDVVGRSLFGLSIACARCHDHKFDPILARDFYALAGVARNTRRVEGFIDTDARAANLANDARAALNDASIALGVAPQPRALDASIVTRIDDATDGGRAWSRAGHAFDASTALLALNDDGSLALAESGTIDSARLDAQLVGSARSPAFPLTKRFLHLRVRGRESWIRTIIDNYWLDDRNGLLFEGMRRELPAPDASYAASDPRAYPWRIETFDMQRFIGERAYVELIDDRGGWIELDAIMESDESTASAVETWDVDGIASALELTTPLSEPIRLRAVGARDALRACSPPIRALVAEDSGAFDEPVHMRGSSRNYGELAPRAQLSILSAASTHAVALDGSGRLALAQTITDPATPYLWRTLANRVWLKLFGRGIAETPDDFGQLGAAPWSTELLDHLALKLARGATLKQLIREVMLTRAYRSAAGSTELPSSAWQPLPVRRLDAESIRDAMLVASGTLDASTGGRSVPVHLSEHMQGRGRPGASGPVDGASRRSVYLEVRRNFLDPFMQAFDQPLPSTTCGRRHASNVPAQSLALLNSELVHLLAARWGEQLSSGAQREVSDDARIDSMWYAAFARAPRTDERREAREFLTLERGARTDATVDATTNASAQDSAAFTALAHALFCAKEFVFLR